MALTSIDVNHNYELYLNPIYGGTKYNVQVIGVTYIDSVTKNEEDYNIYNTYFSPIGLGITSYYTAIHNDTKIYICNAITALSPLTISTDKLFIPESLINMSDSQEYDKAYAFTFKIYPLIKQIDTDEELTTYTEEIKTKVQNRLKSLVDFSILDTSLDVSYEAIYVEEDTLVSIENDRKTKYNEYIARVNTNNRAEEVKNIEYTKKMNELTAEIANYKTMEDEVTVLKAKLQADIDVYEAWYKEHS